MSRRRRRSVQLRSWCGTAFDFEHRFSSFHKRSVRDSAYITSFLAKPRISTHTRVWLSSLDKRDVCCYRGCFRGPSAWLFSFFSVCLLRAYARVCDARYSQLRNVGVSQHNRRLPCPGSLLIWKALTTVQNQTPFSVVPSPPYGSSYAPANTHRPHDI